jgi:hypothetical protein
MKIPVWLATVLVSAVIAAAGGAFEGLRGDMEKVRTDITQLKVDVATIKERTERPSVKAGSQVAAVPMP